MGEQGKVEVGGLVWVAAAGKVGQVRYLTADGFAGVALVNEQGRVDEWHPSQVRPIDSREAARITAGQMAG